MTKNGKTNCYLSSNLKIKYKIEPSLAIEMRSRPKKINGYHIIWQNWMDNPKEIIILHLDNLNFWPALIFDQLYGSKKKTILNENRAIKDVERFSLTDRLLVSLFALYLSDIVTSHFVKFILILLFLISFYILNQFGIFIIIL